MNFEIKLPKNNKKDFEKVPKKYKDKFKKILKLKIKELNKHFDNDGWDLNISSIKEDIYHDLLEFNLDYIIMSEIIHKCKVSCEYSFKKNIPGFVYYKENYQAVYYDIYKNKIIILPRNKANESKFKYLEKNGYLHLGVL
jgi:hypothetical protein